MAENIYKKLLDWLNISIKTKNNSPLIQPLRQSISTGKKESVVFDDKLQKYWDWWLNECHEDRNSLQDRFDRYKDLDYMQKNDSVTAMAVDLYSDEFVQADTQNQVISCKAKSKKNEAYIMDLLDSWGFTDADRLRTIARELVLFGDSFFVTTLDDNFGFIDCMPLNVFTVLERIEFNLNKWIKEKKVNQFATNVIGGSRAETFKQLLDKKALSKEKNQISYLFRPYTFAFEIEGGILLPSWNVLHFRLNSDDSEFYPYGRPLLLNMLAPFRQLEASKTLMELARIAQFPVELVKVKNDENLTEMDLWQKVVEAQIEFENLSNKSTPKETPAIGQRYYLPENLIDFEIKENRINSDAIKDIELLRDDHIMGSRIPKGYLIVDRSSFGTSGQALLQQYKPFGRAVYALQSTFLKQLTEKVKLHLHITGDLEGKDTEFELMMNYPVLEDSSDRLRAKQDTLRLASDVISNIQNALGTREGLPPEVIIGVFSELSFLSPEDVEAWVKSSVESLSENGRPYVSTKTKLSESANKLLHENGDFIIRDAYFKARRKKGFYEGVNNQKHFVSSNMKNSENDILYELFSVKKDKIEG
ncbi:MAG: hypothetical protein GF311_28385 [Candidatus Lokiarchaeota archaeon]|nr:hypothetical protein [Candidatus Lokiarchaeota archaeon]